MSDKLFWLRILVLACFAVLAFGYVSVRCGMRERLTVIEAKIDLS